MTSFNKTIHDLRIEFNISQQQLADAIGVSQSTIAKIEVGRNEATASTIRKLADFFNVSTDYLLGRTDELGGAILPSPANDLSSEERKLVEDYRGLGKPLKDLLQSMIRTWQSDELPASSLSPRKKA